MKKRLLIVDDSFINALSALIAFENHPNVDLPEVAMNFSEGERLLEKADLALLDIQGVRGRELGEICKEKNIPYILVTAVTKIQLSDINHQPDHHEKETTGIAIAKEDKEGDLELLEVINKTEKDEEAWLKAYELLNKVYDK